MTIGDGIFWSTVLLLLSAAIHQITLRKKWRIVGKVSAICLAIAAGIASCVFGWVYVSNLPPSPSRVSELSGAKLGMSPTDVSLALGRPDVFSGPYVEEDRTRIDSIYSDKRLSISFYGKDKYSAKAESICVWDSYASLMGLMIGNSRESVIKRLGKPDSTSIDSDGLSEIVSYQKWGASFYISKGSVTMECIHSFPLMRFTKEILSPSQQIVADKNREIEKQKAIVAEKLREEKEEQKKQSLKLLPPQKKPLQKSTKLLDPCAPDLSKRERMNRLAGFGEIRQTGMDAYIAGNHSIIFGVGDKIYSCY